jgi:cytochrome c biogenesis protein
LIERIPYEIIKTSKVLKIFTDLKFAILVLTILAIASSLGSFIEQDESVSFYQQNYAKHPFMVLLIGFNSFLEDDHVYTTWWFLSLIITLGICLISCTVTRQFPLL